MKIRTLTLWLVANSTVLATTISGINLLGNSNSASIVGAGFRDAQGKLPLRFEINKGQADSRAHFLARGSAFSVSLTPNYLVLGLSRAKELRPSSKPVPNDRVQKLANTQIASLKIKLVNANRHARIVGLDAFPGHSNYFVGNKPASWRTEIPAYAKVKYQNVYTGTDLVLHGNQQQLEYDFVLAPGADPDVISLRFFGANGLTLDNEGDLVVQTPLGRVVQHPPLVYQEVSGVKHRIRAEYVLRDKHQVGFRVSSYDFAKPLVIDPVLSFSTLIGGSADDFGLDVAVDASGSIYLVGTTGSTDFPTTSGAFQPTRGGTVFVTKLNAAGSAILFSTYLGGGSDVGSSIALDPSGNVYVTGNTTSAGFPTVNASQPVFGGKSLVYGDAFVAKLNATGSALLYSTYLGGSKDDRGLKIAVDSSGNAYVGGETISNNFPTVKPFQGVFAGGDSSSIDFAPSETGDAFVAKLNSSGALVYSSYLGGSRGDIATGIAVDASGSAYVTGRTISPNFPTLSPLQGFTASPDAFITKVSSSGGLVYSTYLGGAGIDEANDIAVDRAGNAYVVGSTFSLDFPTVNALQPTKRGPEDIFFVKLNAAGSALLYSTYLGGSDEDVGKGIALDANGNIFLTGSTKSTDFPTKSAIQARNAGDFDVFVVKLNVSANAIIYSTYLGGSSKETAEHIVVDSSGNAYIVGTTSSADFPISKAVQPGLRGGSDAFIVKLSDGKKLYFAQFGDGSQGSASIFSQITLLNLDSTPANVVLELSDDFGNPMSVDLNGTIAAGRKDVVIPADGALTLKTAGQGPIQAGSVTVSSDRNISGVILFGGSVGTAGVGDSRPLRKFVAPMETNPGVNTGIAMMGLGEDQRIQLELRDQQGKPIAQSSIVLSARSHVAKFLTELQWDTPPNFSNFSGTLTATGTAEFGATVIRVSPGQFATLPVAEKN